MNVKSQKDFLSGLILAIVGGVFAWSSHSYQIGDSAHMGPGYFPLLLGGLLAFLGGAIVLQAMVVNPGDGGKIGSIAWKPLFFVIGANLVFGLLVGGIASIKIPAFGLIAGIYALTFISALAGEEFKFVEVLILATVLSIMSYLTFIVLLNLPFQAWPTFN